MSTFIERSDYHNMRDSILNQIVDDDDALLDGVELEAIEEVKNYLFQHYDTTTIFSQTGDDRSKLVLKWCKHVVLYIAHERIPDDQVPDRIIKNYDDTISLLTRINSGKMNVDLPRVQNDEEENKTKFRWGSQNRRSEF